MRAPDIVGRTIVGVAPTRWYDERLKQWRMDCFRVDLDDGSSLHPFAFAHEEGPGATIRHQKAPTTEEQ